MWQEDAPSGLSSFYTKHSSAEFCDSLSACLIPTSCLWQVFSTPASRDCLVLERHFSVLREISIFHLSDSIIYPFTSDMSCFSYFHAQRSFVQMSVSTSVRLGGSECVLKSSSGIQQNASYLGFHCFPTAEWAAFVCQ